MARRGGLIGIIKAPYIQGLSNSFIAREVKYRLFSESYAEGYYLSPELTMKTIVDNNLWRESFFGRHG